MMQSLEPRRLLSLVINPTFASNITSDPNAATIEATINQAIDAYEAAFANTNVTVNITFQEGGGLGGSSTYYVSESYSDYRNALVSHSTTANDTTALASLPTTSNNPVNNNANVNLKTALARALGFSADPPSGKPDSTITLNTSICNLDRTSIDPSKYDLLAVTSHEIDEAIGFGSALDGLNNGDAAPTGAVFADDLFRYDNTGARSFDTALATQAFFSIDGGTTDLARFNQTQGGDFGDWFSTAAHTPQVQDAFGTPGATPNLGVELTRLDVIGYTPGAISAPDLTSGGDQSAVEGASKSFNIGSITDPDTGPWGIVVSWGDGTPDTTYFLNSAGSLGTKTHKYTEEGNYTVTVTVTDFTSLSDSATFNVSVSDPAVVATGGYSISAVEGSASGSRTVATFTDPGGPEALSDYSALIDWGDGTAATPGVISGPSGGVFTVSGNHTYAEEGNYTITATISHDSAPSSTVTSSASVSDPAVIPTGGFTLNLTEGSASGLRTVATFTDPGGAEVLGDYSATIDWGDGTTPTAGIITVDSSGVFTVQGQHTYATGGGSPDDFGNTFCDGTAPAYSRNITVTISHELAPTAQTTSTAHIELTPGTAHMAGGSLIVVATTANDAVNISPAGNDPSSVIVQLNSVTLGTFTLGAGGRVIVAGLAGNDNIQVAGGVSADTVLYGGPGDDRLKGGGGRNIEVGCDGNDTLNAGNLGDLLIGGNDADRIVGGNGNDIIVAANLLDGSANEDTKFSDLVAILNGGGFLAGDDGAADVLTGSSGVDVFVFNYAGGGTIDTATDKVDIGIDV